jgi:hypothetical protein
MSTSRNDIGEAVDRERDFQDEKFGPLAKKISDDTYVLGTGAHTLGEWILLMEGELAEAKVALLKGGKGRDSVRSEILQVVAVGIACLEQHGLDEPHSRRQI